MTFRWRILAFAVASGVLWGAVDALRVILGKHLFLVSQEEGILLGVGMVGTALAAGLSTLPIAGMEFTRPKTVGFLWGGAFLGAGALGVWWFTDPPPFQKPFLFQGNLAVYAGIVAMMGASIYLLQRLPPKILMLLTTAITLVALGISWNPLPSPTEALPAGAPNILLVTLDTSRADRFGAYGNTKVDTHNFDAIAKDGSLFQSASAVAAVTGPSHTSLLSGSGPWDHGVLLNGVPLPEDRTLLSETLHRHGWNTAAFVSAYVLGGELGFSRGFDVYDDDFGWLRGSGGLLPVRLWDMAHRHQDPDDVLQRRGENTTDLAIRWIQRQKGAWFAWVHLFDAHGPYEPPAPYNSRYYQGDPRDPSHTSMSKVQDVASYLLPSLKGITDLDYVFAQYEGEISYADAQMGRLLEAVPTRDTLVVVIGDHGESLGEHGVWFNHGDDVYETSVHVPFAVRWPGRVQSGLQVKTPVDGTMVAPTILGLVGVSPPPSMTGTSFASFLEGQSQGPSTIAHSICFDRKANLQERQAGHITAPRYRMVGLSSATSRYIYRELSTQEEYFDLQTDPLGLQDRAPSLRSSQPDSVDLLQKQAQSLLSGHASERSAVDLSEEERQRLEALGYLQQ